MPGVSPFPYGKYSVCMATNAREIGTLTRLVAAEIRMTRARRRVPQQALSDVTGIPPNSLSQMENCEMVIDMEQLDKIATAFGIDPDVFLASAIRHADADKGPLVTDRASAAGKPSAEHVDQLKKQAAARRQR